MEKDNKEFFKAHHDPQRGWMLNDYPIKTPGRTQVEISGNKYNRTPALQKIFTDASYDVATSVNDTEKVVFRDISQKTGYNNRKRTKGRLSGRHRCIKYDLDKEVRRILNLDTKLKGRGIEKIIIPSNIIDKNPRLEVLLGLKFKIIWPH